jgi:DNA-3-methyladenine glycosylase II
MHDQEIQEALRHLRRQDPIMREVIRKAGPFTMRLRRNRFQSLVYSIIGQQISSKAAASIRARLVEHMKPEQISPQNIARLTPATLRILGLSSQKSRYLLDLAERVLSGEVRLNRMSRMPDDEVIEALVQVKGIGVWTAQMFLIFSLGRPDVFPHDDLGVRSAIRNLYGLDDLPTKEVSHKIASPWRPYASVASWYCWRSLEFEKEKTEFMRASSPP